MLRTSRLHLTVILTLLVSALLSLSMAGFAGAAAAITATPISKSIAPSGLIAFASGRTGNAEIFVMRPDGSGVSQLTNNPAIEAAPSWSPDGKHIVFVSNRDGLSELYVMNANGSGTKRLTNTSRLVESEPAWSPNGKQIAYFVAEYDSLANKAGPRDLYTMNADGSNQRLLLTAEALDMKFGTTVTWSPDSKKIALSAQKTGDTKGDIYTMDANGKNMTALTTGDGDNFWPAWSPDGKLIAFMSGKKTTGNPTFGIHVIKPDGTGEQTLTLTDQMAAMPSWSPDSKQISFSAVDLQNNIANIYVMNTDGGNPVQLTQESDFEAFPAWSPASASLKLPLPTFVPQPTPKGAAANCPVTTDKTYGYTEDNPINVGGGDFDGPPREDDYFAQLRGPKGEAINSDRTGSFPRKSDGVILDAYDVTYAGHSQPITLYVNEYSDTPPQIPVGFSCAPAK